MVQFLWLRRAVEGVLPAHYGVIKLRKWLMTGALQRFEKIRIFPLTSCAYVLN